VICSDLPMSGATVLVVQHGSTAAQRTVRARLSDVAETVRSEGIRPPAIIVIGPVAGFGS